MATLTKAINNDLYDCILPPYGSPRVYVPVWDNAQRMFIFDEYESASGHRYYRGIRFCNRMAIVEKVGLYHSWTYIDGIEIYAFNEKKLELVQTRDYNKVFRNEEFIRTESVSMVKDYLFGVLKTQRMPMQMEQIEALARELVADCYKSFLDQDFNVKLTQIIPAIEQK